MRIRSILSIMAFAFGLASVSVSCGKDKPVSDDTLPIEAVSEGERYVLDTLGSRVEWKGFKVFKSENTSHFGELKFESGEVSVKDGHLVGGRFVASMASLVSVDLQREPDKKAKLESHLKNEDFFEVERFPTASYQITKVLPSEGGDYNTVLEGSMTIKGITLPVSFNANVSVSEDQVRIATEPKNLDREAFGVKFQAPLQNGVITKEMNVQILVKAFKRG
ncbi:YceI family protein [Bergeyella sp. RCAD1439]|uniref:YceI family protein n=1 Tax=Bergeyella anatis TaxID=3113737 RepID=UPI002E17E9D0|nr:YceI family protein [Bergeyella sp. RCAD1439]